MWPRWTRALAAREPRPSEEPVMKIRAILVVDGWVVAAEGEWIAGETGLYLCFMLVWIVWSSLVDAGVKGGLRSEYVTAEWNTVGRRFWL